MKSRKECISFLMKHPDKFGHMLGFTKLTKIHNEWIKKMAFGKEDHTLQGHRQAFKTTCLSISLGLDMIFYPNKRILFMRKTDDDVKEIIKQVKNILLHPVTQYFVQCIYGVNLKLTVDNATELSTNLTTDIKGTSQLVGIGTGASITGKHYDIIFTDDIVNLKDRISRAERERTKSIYQELINIKNKDGKIFNTGTPWHKEDAFSLMPEPEKWAWQDTGIFTEDEIQEIRDSMSPSLFAANYELKHIASEDVIFSDPVLHGDITKIQQAKFCHIDAAYGGEDYTAFTICRKAEGKYYIYGRLWQKAVDDCIAEIREDREKFNAGVILCERNGDKGYLKKELQRQGERCSDYWEDMNKYIKIVTYLKGVWKDVVFIEGTDQEYIDQILDYNEFAEHDDAPDSCASAIRKLWKMRDETAEESVSAFGY